MDKTLLRFLCVTFLAASFNFSKMNPDLYAYVNSATSSPGSDDVIVNNSFRIFPDTVLQVETSVYCRPENPSFIAAAAITDIYPGGYTMGFYKSTNGGFNWSGTEAIKTSSGSIIVTIGDPSISIDKNGKIILSYIAPSSNVGVSFSTNNGLNWSATTNIPGVTIPDKISNTSDNNPSSPYYGNTYIVYNEREGINFSRTTNGGLNWSVSQRISPALNFVRTGASIAVGSLGEIYVTWPFLLETQRYVGFAKSTDGGVTWTSSDYGFPVFPVNTGFRINLNLVKTNGLPVIAVDNSGGPRNGWIYVVCSERADPLSPATDSCDIVIHCSTNKGSTWPMSFRVNQDSGPYRHQVFPSVNVDSYGGVNVVYYDNRNTPTKDSFEVYVSRSVNGGFSFEDYKVSSGKFKIKQLPSNKMLFGVPSYIGSYCGITSSENRIIPLWYDNKTGEDYQATTSVIQIIPQSVIKLIPEGFYNEYTDRLNICDSVGFFLRNSLSPYSKVDSASCTIDSLSFEALVKFKNVISGNYFIEIHHRNSLETWSMTPVNYSSVSGIIYDFSDSSSKAFGENMVIKGSRYCIYSGDVNCDGIIDPTDLLEIDNNVSGFIIGYQPTDLNGDYITDSSDLLICDNNINKFISRIIP